MLKTRTNEDKSYKYQKRKTNAGNSIGFRFVFLCM